ncbi:MAG: Phosphatidyl-myo-inositol mannosyltransferase [Anaerolineae bacterium]|nr:Phosphatidyl-myo-inositol mannosyltransferase [Anaerolineae bacterium]
MKIALVTPYDYPYPGGVTEHIMQLDREFRRRGYDTRIIAASSQDKEPLQDNVIKVSGAVRTFPFSGSNVRVPIAPQVYRRVKKILREEKFDVVHAHEPAAPPLCPIVLRHSHAVNIGTFHAYRETNTVYQMARPLLRPVYNKLDGRIFVSQAVRDFTLAQFPGDFRIIPNGIDFQRFANPALEPIERFNDGRPNILFVGRLDKRKGFHHLIRAFPFIKQAFPDARLIVVGAYDDGDKAPFIRYARRHHLRSVHFVGYVSREMLPRYYRTAHLFCAPSTGFESFGIVLLEAMAAGLPIVASDIAGYRLVLTHDRQGMLVPPEDSDAIAHAVTALLAAPSARLRMAEQGRCTAVQYDWRHIADQVLAYYQELLSTRREVAKRASFSRRVWRRIVLAPSE